MHVARGMRVTSHALKRGDKSPQSIAGFARDGHTLWWLSGLRLKEPLVRRAINRYRFASRNRSYNRNNGPLRGAVVPLYERQGPRIVTESSIGCVEAAHRAAATARDSKICNLHFINELRY